MNIVLTGGGTGGHIYPAIAIGDKIKEKYPEANILYIGYKGGLEANIVPKCGYEIKYVESRWVDRKNILSIFRTAKSVLKGKKQAYDIMKDFRPDVVIGTGGYVSYPVILAGKKYGAKLYLHEQNAYPGMANRQLAKYVDKIFLGFESARNHFSSIEKNKLIYTGNPVRTAFYNLSKNDARKALGIASNKFVIFSFGGSQGARAINDSMVEVVKKYKNDENTVMLFATGEWYYNEIKNLFEGQKISNLLIKDYITDMPNHLAAADLIIGRAGALSLAEITMSKRASILIPSPNVTGNHQYYNAKAVADMGGAIIIMENKEMLKNVLVSVDKLISNPKLIKDMEQGSEKASKPLAVDIILDNIF